MPGKVNPVIPEAVSQVAMVVMSNDGTIAAAAGAGSLELNPFLPLIADCLLASISLLTQGCLILRRHCVEGIEADEARCRRHVESSTAMATALVGTLGYDTVCEVVGRAAASGRTVREVVLSGETMKWFFDNYLLNDTNRKNPTVSPLQASIDQLSKLPPALIIVGENDVLRDEGEAYAHKLMQVWSPYYSNSLSRVLYMIL